MALDVAMMGLPFIRKPVKNLVKSKYKYKPLLNKVAVF